MIVYNDNEYDTLQNNETNKENLDNQQGQKNRCSCWENQKQK